MILPLTKPKLRGVTLIETLAVLAVLGGLLVAMSTPFIHTLTSYRGQYESESLQVEGQRAVAEFTYLGSRASYYTCTSSDVVTFYDSANDYASFRFVPNGTMVDGLRQGTFSIVMPTGTYQYRGLWLASATGPFEVTHAGIGLSIKGYSSGGPVTFKSFVTSSL